MIEFGKLNWRLIGLWLLLAVSGLFAIYSATRGPVSEFLPSFIVNNFQRQLVWVGASAVMILLIQFISPRTFQGASYLFYGLGVTLMILTLFAGVEINGSKSWIRIGPVNVQAGLITLPATILAVSNYLTRKRNITAEDLRTAITALSFFLVPVLLLLLQNETGLALVFLLLIPVMLFWSGLPSAITLLIISPGIIGYFSILGWWLGLVAAIMIAATTFVLQRRLWISVSALVFGLLIIGGLEFAFQQVLQPHQIARIQSFANPSLDPQGSGWNILQAKTAIGSGGLTGKGFMEGTQTQLRFLPEQWTDFIYCVVAEEFGFLGAGGLILLFTLLFFTMLTMAGSHKNPFAQLVMIGFTFLLFIQFLINIGSATSLIPIIGIPLPFISYGGAAFLTNSMMIAICLNFDLYKRTFSIYS